MELTRDSKITKKGLNGNLKPKLLSPGAAPLARLLNSPRSFFTGVTVSTLLGQGREKMAEQVLIWEFLRR